MRNQAVKATLGRPPSILMEVKMQVLSMMEVEAVSGAADTTAPIDNPGSEFGKTVNDAAQLINTVGTWIGSHLYDWLN
jgi:hypothetical protein